MSAAVLRKTLRDSALVLSLATAALVVFEILFIFAVSFQVRDVQMHLQRLPEWGRHLLTSLLGSNVLERLTPTSLMAVGFAHPFVHIILWVFTVTFCTRVLAGEIDRGTADLLLSLPIRRSSLYLSLTAVWIGAGLLLCAAPWYGTYLGQRIWHKGPFDLEALARVTCNLYVLYLAIGSGCLLVSAMASRRASAIGVVTAVLLASFVLNFLTGLDLLTDTWLPLKKLAFLGVLHYYRPLEVVDSGGWATENMRVLAEVAAGCWLAGLIVFCRRDIRTG